MPLDVLGCTRNTMVPSESIFSGLPQGGPKNLGRRVWEIFESVPCLGLAIVIIGHERGISSKRKSSSCVDYVPALCTHRPSLYPIGRFGECVGSLSPVACLGLDAKRQVNQVV